MFIKVNLGVKKFQYQRHNDLKKSHLRHMVQWKQNSAQHLHDCIVNKDHPSEVNERSTVTVVVSFVRRVPRQFPVRAKRFITINFTRARKTKQLGWDISADADETDFRRIIICELRRWASVSDLAPFFFSIITWENAEAWFAYCDRLVNGLIEAGVKGIRTNRRNYRCMIVVWEYMRLLLNDLAWLSYSDLVESDTFFSNENQSHFFPS